MLIHLVLRLFLIFPVCFIRMATVHIAIILFVMIVPGTSLHSFHLLLFHCIHTVHKAQRYHIRIRHGTQDIFHPYVIFPSGINKDIAVLYGNDILRCRLVRMSLLTRFQEHFNICLISRDLPYKIVRRKDRCHDTDLPAISISCRITGTAGYCYAAACTRASCRHKCHAPGEQYGSKRFASCS